MGIGGFYYLKISEKIKLTNFRDDKLRYMTYMPYMLYQCSSLEELNTSNFYTSKIKDMNYLFGECSSLKKWYILNLDTTNVINMSYMFFGCSLLRILNFSKI